MRLYALLLTKMAADSWTLASWTCGKVIRYGPLLTGADVDFGNSDADGEVQS
jgi:hypothetical protein